MDYELAKELKDAGFPQKGNGDVLNENGLPRPVFQNELQAKAVGLTFGNYVYFPTLSELIEACGEEFANLQKVTDGLFVAFANTKYRNAKLFQQGKTPSEAVAHLWLVLNK